MHESRWDKKLRTIISVIVSSRHFFQDRVKTERTMLWTADALKGDLVSVLKRLGANENLLRALSLL